MCPESFLLKFRKKLYFFLSVFRFDPLFRMIIIICLKIILGLYILRTCQNVSVIVSVRLVSSYGLVVRCRIGR